MPRRVRRSGIQGADDCVPYDGSRPGFAGHLSMRVVLVVAAEQREKALRAYRRLDLPHLLLLEPGGWDDRAAAGALGGIPVEQPAALHDHRRMAQARLLDHPIELGRIVGRESHAAM